jgi:hypothetical protein
MHSYHTEESQNGSLFFIQTPQDSKYLFRIDNSSEEYLEDYLEDYIQNSYLHGFTVAPKPKFMECCELFETIRHIIFNHVSNHNKIVKIEMDKGLNRKDFVLKFFKNRPDHIKGLTHVVNGITIYYFFSSHRIESTELIASLIKEFSIGNDNEDEEE